MRKKKKSIPIHIRDTFGRWEVVREIPGSRRGKKYLCKCVCGTERPVLASSLRAGRSKSCGCARAKHGMSYSPEYRAWESMKRRCFLLSHFAYADYGGRGITVWEKWVLSFEQFFEDVGSRPGPEYSLDRIDCNGNYEPGNVRWATAKEQANNRRKAKKYSARRRNEYVSTQEQCEDAQRTADVLDVLPEHLAPF